MQCLRLRWGKGEEKHAPKEIFTSFSFILKVWVVLLAEHFERSVECMSFNFLSKFSVIQHCCRISKLYSFTNICSIKQLVQRTFSPKHLGHEMLLPSHLKWGKRIALMSGNVLLMDVEWIKFYESQYMKDRYCLVTMRQWTNLNKNKLVKQAWKKMIVPFKSSKFIRPKEHAKSGCVHWLTSQVSIF